MITRNVFLIIPHLIAIEGVVVQDTCNKLVHFLSFSTAASCQYSPNMSGLDSPKLTKFVEEPSALRCPVCRRVFRDPVISIRCGHTFCTSCIQSLISTGLKCPLDDQDCDSGQLVLNRAVKGQIDDLMIHCCHGVRVTSPPEAILELEEDGCKEVFRLGDRDSHESSCGFAKVLCPLGGSVCGVMRRYQLEGHTSTCSKVPCPYGSFGE